MDTNTPNTPNTPPAQPAPTPAAPAAPTTLEIGGQKMTIEQIQAALAEKQQLATAAEKLMQDGVDVSEQREAAIAVLKSKGYTQDEIDRRVERLFAEPESEETPVAPINQPAASPTIEQLQKELAELKAQQAEIGRLHSIRSTERIEAVVSESLSESVRDEQNGLGQVEKLLKASKQSAEEVKKAMDGFAERVKKEAVASLMQIKQREGVVTEAAIRREMKAAAASLAQTLKPLLGSVKTLGASSSNGVWEQVLNRPDRQPPKPFTPGRDDHGKTKADFEAWAANLISKDTARNMIGRQTPTV
jgi:hypothetical protein